MQKFEEFEAEWLESLSHEERDEARKAIAAGRTWGNSGQSRDTLVAVLKFARVAYGYGGEYETANGGLWDSDHDAAYDHYYTSMDEAVGDDEVFTNHVTNEFHGVNQLGFFIGVGQAVDDMMKAAA